MEPDERNRLQEIPTGQYVGLDPLAKVRVEQEAFNNAWLGRTPQRSAIQKVGFFLISVVILGLGVAMLPPAFVAAMQGALFGLLMSLLMCLVGVLGLYKVFER